MATRIEPSSYLAANNKVYMALAAVMLAVLLGIAYVALTRTSTTVPSDTPVYIN